MEKLIELLNEYAHTYADHYDDTGKEIEIRFITHTDQCFTYECEWKVETLVDDVVISKRYWFIKWLVENDKIDLWKIKKLYRKSNEHSVYTYPIMYEYSDYESLFMILSISDTPIDDLISYLK